MYTMSESDIQLISDFAGALNTGRAGLTPAARFGNLTAVAVEGTPSVKWSHADELEELVKRARGQAVPPGSKVVLPDWGVTEFGYRYVPATPGVKYVCKFSIPNPPVSAVSPIVRASLSSGSGNSSLLLKVSDTDDAELGEAGTPTPETTLAYEAVAGLTKYAIFALGKDQPATTIGLLIQVPQSGTPA